MATAGVTEFGFWKRQEMIWKISPALKERDPDLLPNLSCPVQYKHLALDLWHGSESCFLESLAV